MIKRKISAILAAVITFSSMTGAFAVYDPAKNPMTVIPESDLFKGDGDTFTKAQFQEWINKGLSENGVHKVLDGNYAFVANQDNWWNLDHNETFGANTAIMSDDGAYSINTALAQQIFGVTGSGEYINIDDITAKTSGWETFVDPRGFCLFSKDMDRSIQKESVSLEKYNGQDAKQYTSYYPVGQAIGEVTWDNLEITDADFDAYLANWKKTLTQLDVIHEHEDYVQWSFDEAKKYMEMFDETSASGFSDNNIYQGFVRLRYMAEAYAVLDHLNREDIDAEELKRQILHVMEILYQNQFGVNGAMLKVVDDWFNTRIVYPYYMADALLLMWDDVPEDKRQKYINAGLIITVEGQISRFQVPPKSGVIDLNMQTLINPYNNWTNFLWCVHASIRWAALARDEYRMNRYFKYLCQVFEETTASGNFLDIPSTRDGIYEDGTFKFHNWFFYGLGYGASMAMEISEVLMTTVGTAFDLRKQYGYERVYEWIEKAWIPLLYNGEMVKIATGRESQTYHSAFAIITAIMTIAQQAPPQTREKLLRQLKPAIGDKMEYYRDIPKRIPGYYSFIFPTVQENINEAVKYIDSIEVENPVYTKVYYNGDKVVQKTNDYTFMLSMSSERIGRYEGINNQSYGDWNIGSGMTYIINDAVQFSPDWWAKVDKYKIPGTTVDGMTHRINSEYGLGQPENSWAGSVTNGTYTASAMQLPGNWRWAETKFVGNKSYYILPDKIICLGSDLKGGQGEVTTILNNVLLDKTKETPEECYIGEKTVTTEVDKKEIYEDVRYIWEGNRGYAFLDNTTVSAERVKDNKKFVGWGVTHSPTDDPFMTLMIEHGSSEQVADYAYVILPQKSLEETKAYNPHDEFEVIRKDSVMHAIKLKENGVVMANIFKPAKLMGFMFNTPCAVILEPQNDGYKVNICEPTQKAAFVKLELPEDKPVTNNTSEIVKDKNIVSVKVDDNYGKTYSFDYNLDGKSGLKNSENVFVRDIKIKVGNKKIITTLYAETKDGDSLTFSISKAPENGSAKIIGDRLEYIPEKSVSYTDEIVVAAMDSQNRVSEYKIIIEK